MAGSHLLKRPSDAVSFMQTRPLAVCRSYSVKYDGSLMTKQIWLLLALKYVTARLINRYSLPSFPKMPWEIGNVDYQNLCCSLLLISFYYDSAYNAGHNMITFTQPNCFHLRALVLTSRRKTPFNHVFFSLDPSGTPQRLRMSHKHIPDRRKCLGKQANVKRDMIITHIYTIQ